MVLHEQPFVQNPGRIALYLDQPGEGLGGGCQLAGVLLPPPHDPRAGGGELREPAPALHAAAQHTVKLAPGQQQRQVEDLHCLGFLVVSIFGLNELSGYLSCKGQATYDQDSLRSPPAPGRCVLRGVSAASELDCILSWLAVGP